MITKVFISGSIAIRSLPIAVIDSIDKIIAQNFQILIGDADGVDLLVQKYCLSKRYLNVVVYYVTDMPRNLATREFETKHICVSSSSKNERERQMQKDKEMTNDSNFSFVIWDSKSKGSYSNIIRALEQDKRVKLYLINESKFLEQDKIKKLNIEFIFRESNGYSASEVISYLKNNVTEKFERTQNLNKYLVEKSVIRREGRIYVPERNYSHLFIIKKHKGKTTGFTFKNAFIDWLEKELKMTDNEFLQEQITLFPTEPEIGDVATF